MIMVYVKSTKKIVKQFPLSKEPVPFIVLLVTENLTKVWEHLFQKPNTWNPRDRDRGPKTEQSVPLYHYAILTHKTWMVDA